MTETVNDSEVTVTVTVTVGTVTVSDRESKWQGH